MLSFKLNNLTLTRRNFNTSGMKCCGREIGRALRRMLYMFLMVVFNFHFSIESLSIVEKVLYEALMLKLGDVKV